MQKNLLHAKSAAAAALAAAGGWLAFSSVSLSDYGVPQLAMAGVAALIAAWRLGVSTRWAAWLVLFGWHLGAGMPIPQAWADFFGNSSGWIAWPLWAALVSAPALLLPPRHAAWSLAAGSALVALTPLGMLNPWMASIAAFPGLGAAGLALALLVLTLPVIRHEKAFVSAAIVVAALGSVLNARQPHLPQIPETMRSAWAMATHEGRHSEIAREWIARQLRTSRAAIRAIAEGARLVVTPEGTVDDWERIAERVWQGARAVAQGHGAQLLVGVYMQSPTGWRDGLLDVVSGEFYPASVTLPVSMWRPWSQDQHYPNDYSALPRLIETRYGPAAYVICYEEMLVFPLAVKALAGGKFILAASNQWFTTAATAEAQKRSIEFQARLWGLPLLRAVNWPS